ncbi:glycoside hydrolase family 43 protein [Solwaraspora sp. WMMD937]|uniref:glycoside hydrolase family 43 protein n=1 Tax=Solwaraspora sp. WMMD937 TaxID=3016090 RepID=UPI00249C8A61|nr:glycoside hydrolase family 43 protein [Solwaraspora sp. WMMD937]WFE21567.1 glycoside hydrolase family 43 protein [Solwaraspora sp. WMMD937]
MPTDTTDVATSARVITNPVLRGFYPDPSVLRVGDDYYLATSTFEWYPGVTLHHSRDLVHWRPLDGILTERRLLDLTGAGDSCGVWAPDLTYAHGLFHLVYSDVASFASGYWDPQNYLITAPSIDGPWSDPVPLHAHGFDASLFHDDDGSTWLLAMTADWRPGRDRFGGIEIQRYDRDARRLVGDPVTIFTGTPTGLTEGPHIYRHDGWYYLVTAEGGTSWEHQVTVARSRALLGPYEADPAGPMLTSVGRPELALQKAGHGSLVQTQRGEWYLAHLVGRPYSPLGRCVLGRETAIQRVDWSADGWPRVAGQIPAEQVPAPDLPAHPWPAEPSTDHFDAATLGPRWSTLRRPAGPDWTDLTSRPSHLRIVGGQSPVGRQRPSLVARRVTAPNCVLETLVEFRAATPRQLAGVTGYYNTENWHYAYLTRTDDGRQELQLLSCDSGRRQSHPQASVDVTDVARLGLRVVFDGPVLRFGYHRGDHWRELPVELDATILSDEYAARMTDGEPEAWGFTGAFVGLWVQDIGNDGGYADFDHATYREL